MMWIALLSVALAAPTIAPSDGLSATGLARPAWAGLAKRVDPGLSVAEATGELERAWQERRALANEEAAARVDRLVATLRPTLDAAQRELLQRALFLRGVLQADDAGGLDRVPGAVAVGDQRVPPAWIEAISVSPGSPAPPATDADFAARVYEQARTRLVATASVVLDLAAPVAGEVRVDGLPVRDKVTLLPGRHTVSWHPPGGDPVALVVDLPTDDPITPLQQAVEGEAELPEALAASFHRDLGSPAMIVEEGGKTRTVWLVDGPARWGKPRFGVGAAVGAWTLATGGAPTPDRCGSGLADAPTKLLVPGAVEGRLDVGPWRAVVTGGVNAAALGGDAFAMPAPPCVAGVPVGTEMRKVVPWVGAGVARRVPVGRVELSPFVRVGTLTVLAVTEAGLGLGVPVGAAAVELRVHGGAAFNTWSGEGNRAGFIGGFETAVTWRAP